MKLKFFLIKTISRVNEIARNVAVCNGIEECVIKAKVGESCGCFCLHMVLVV